MDDHVYKNIAFKLMEDILGDTCKLVTKSSNAVYLSISLDDHVYFSILQVNITSMQVW